MIFRSRFPDIEIPAASLPAFVLERAESFGDRPALIDGVSGLTVSYARLASDVRHLAAGLAAAGLRKGDVVALFAPNGPEWAIVFHAVLSAGGVVTTINSLATEDDIAKQLNDAGARMIVAAPPFMDRARPAAIAASVPTVYAIGEADGAIPLASLLATGNAPPSVEIRPDDLAVLPYSSGTTGLPKGVRLSHRNLVANVLQIGTLQDVQEDEKLIGVLPFFHIYGMTVIMNLGLRRGATIVTMPRFELDSFLDIMERWRVTRAFIVPPIVLALAKHPSVDDHDLSSLRMIMCGAAPLDAALAEICGRRIDCAVVQGYGLTESSPVTHANSDRPGRGRAGSIGELAPSTEARILEIETNRELPRGADGELCIRGPQVMAGYLHDAAATAASIDEDGWLHTGDIGHVDEDGFFFIVDRLKELIKYKGYQVPPAELEAVLLSHPMITDAAVIPVPDTVAGEIPKAYIVVREPIDPDEVLAFVAERVASYKRVRRIEVIDAIPKSASGKILRRVLVQRDRASSSAPHG